MDSKFLQGMKNRFKTKHSTNFDFVHLIAIGLDSEDAARFYHKIEESLDHDDLAMDFVHCLEIEHDIPYHDNPHFYDYKSFEDALNDIFKIFQYDKFRFLILFSYQSALNTGHLKTEWLRDDLKAFLDKVVDLSDLRDRL